MRAKRLVIMLVCAAWLTACDRTVPHAAKLFPSATTVRAYIYAQPQDGLRDRVLGEDLRTANATAAPSGGIALTAAQMARLKSVLLRRRPANVSDGDTALSEPAMATTCAFDPHHGFVFLDDKGKIVGTVDICFEC